MKDYDMLEVAESVRQPDQEGVQKVRIPLSPC